MFAFYAILVALVISVAALLVLSLWGIPIVVIVLVALTVYVVATMRKREALTVERDRFEPTGRTRKGTGGATPTNERVGS
jgi:cytochrome c-type biogenesis protein CcmH/NrfF